VLKHRLIVRQTTRGWLSIEGANVRAVEQLMAAPGAGGPSGLGWAGASSYFMHLYVSKKLEDQAKQLRKVMTKELVRFHSQFRVAGLPGLTRAVEGRVTKWQLS